MILADWAWKLILLYNLLLCFLYGWDKRKARRGDWRIPEATLLTMAACLGGPGALLGMLVYHHKTRKLRFVLLVPLLSVLQAAVVWWVHARGFL